METGPVGPRSPMNPGNARPSELLRRARVGSPEAVEELVKRCSPSLEAYLRRRAGARLQRFTSIADLRQEVLLRGVDALRLLPDDATLEDFQALLQRHAQWALGGAARRVQRIDGESVAHGGDAAGPPAPTRSEGDVTRQDERRWLEQQIAELEEPLAAVVRLRLQGRTFAEMADELGVGEDAARKRYLRASLLLRRRSGEPGSPG